VIHHTSRGADHDLSSCLQRAKLSFVGLASVNGNGLQTTAEKSELGDLLCDLDCQFAGRAENEDLRRAKLGVAALDGRDGESGGFSRAC